MGGRGRADTPSGANIGKAALGGMAVRCQTTTAPIDCDRSFGEAKKSQAKAIPREGPFRLHLLRQSGHIQSRSILLTVVVSAFAQKPRKGGAAHGIIIEASIISQTPLAVQPTRNARTQHLSHCLSFPDRQQGQKGPRTKTDDYCLYT